jgi:hypothetical protein
MKLSIIKVWAIFLSFLGIFFIISEINGNRFRSKILESPMLVHGRVNSYSVAYKRADAFCYSFFYNGQTYYSESGNSDYYNLRKYAIYKNFPVIINSLYPEHSQILILPEEFKEYHIPFPDSLKWVKEILHH